MHHFREVFPLAKQLAKTAWRQREAQGVIEQTIEKEPGNRTEADGNLIFPAHQA
jgi:hypothetical protein